MHQYSTFNPLVNFFSLTFCVIVICYTAIPAGVIADFGPQAICVEDSDRSTTVLANCVTHRCVQVEGSDLMTFSLTINGMWVQQWTRWGFTFFLI